MDHHRVLTSSYDAVLVLSFGGPEGPEDVLPFLENVTRGRGVPPERLAEVAEQYRLLGGRSPINDQNRALAAAVAAELAAHGRDLPVYLGNRNWHPYLADTLRTMAADGVRRVAAFATSAWSSYSSCRQYLEDIDRARAEVGEAAPQVDKLRPFSDHPGFIAAQADRVRATLEELEEPEGPDGGRGGAGSPPGAPEAHLVFTAHSIPTSQAATCDYEAQLVEACGLVAAAAGPSAGGERPWHLAYQSRSGPPHVPWLEPDVSVRLAELADRGVRRVVLVPIGFVSDHMEVLHDLDHVALAEAARLGMEARRAPTVGVHPRFVAMVRELVEEAEGRAPRRSLGTLGPRPSPCAADCCPAPVRH